jgi:hypothetical protein
LKFPTLPAHEKNPRIPIHKVQNLGIALKFMEQQGIKLIGIDEGGLMVFLTGNQVH